MDCKGFLKIISEFENGELPDELRKEAGKHMDNCPECKDELKKFRQTISLYKDCMDAKLPSGTTLKIRSSIAKLLNEEKEPVFGPILNINDLSNYLRVEENVVETYHNEIPCFELGGQILFRKEKVDEWIRKREEKFAFELLSSQIGREFHESVFEETRKGGTIWKL